ncbi:NUDIX domain-containing protein [Sphingomonas sabuli]|uniref:NUDIX domain-containing protein n=1 Tax=Sphingomonas sabuli TaxID=2764186 RepID=UPI001FE440D0|nr:NUDIX domain-containing protein [Sphingomonas sabuli]
MPPPLSAGILLYRHTGGATEVLLIHPGGPYWAKKDAGAWMIPKGGVDAGEALADAAVREFREELGSALDRPPQPLVRIKQSGGKIVEVFAAEGDFDPARLDSLHFEMEWPPRSGRMQSFPECDAARWMDLAEARRMMLKSQLPILDALEEKLSRE